MSAPRTAPAEFFQTGLGTLPANAPSYVRRPADDLLFREVQENHFCDVLTTRQMGKSSLMVQTAARLRQAGVRVVLLDLSPKKGETEEQWYNGLVEELAHQLAMDEVGEAWSRHRSELGYARRLMDLLRFLLDRLDGTQLAIFVDEIDATLSLPFRDDFFNAVRACWNLRATEPSFRRLAVVLLGVTTPDALIADKTSTPYNIGVHIELGDFAVDEAGVTLLDGFAMPRDAARVALERIFHWTHGHPYLTYIACQRVAGTSEPLRDEQIDGVIRELFLDEDAAARDKNLNFVRARLVAHPDARRLLRLYRAVRGNRGVADDERSPLHTELKLAGIARVEAGRLVVRNRIYEAAFDERWIRRAMPADGQKWKVRVASAVAAVAVVAAVGLQISQVREQMRLFERVNMYSNPGPHRMERVAESLRMPWGGLQNTTPMLARYYDATARKAEANDLLDRAILYRLRALQLEDTRPRRAAVGRLVQALRALEWRVVFAHDEALIDYDPGSERALVLGPGRLRVYSVREKRWIGSEIVDARLPGKEYFFTGGALVGNGERIAMVLQDELQIWTVDGTKRLCAVPVQKTWGTLVTDPERAYVAVAIAPQGTAIIRALDGVEIARLDTAPPYGIDLGPGGDVVAIGTGRACEIWDVRQQQRIRTFLKGECRYAEPGASPPSPASWVEASLHVSNGVLDLFRETPIAWLLFRWRNYSLNWTSLALPRHFDEPVLIADRASIYLSDRRGVTLTHRPVAHMPRTADVLAGSAQRFAWKGAHLVTTLLNEVQSNAIPPVGAPDGECGECYLLAQDDGMARSVALSPDGRWIAIGYERAVHLQARARSAGETRVLRIPEGTVSSVRFGPTGDRILVLAAVSGSRTSITLWGSSIESPLVHRVFVGDAHAALSDDGNWLAVEDPEHRTISTWNARSGGQGDSNVAARHPVTGMTWAPDHARLAVAYKDSRLFDYVEPRSGLVRDQVEGDPIELGDPFTFSPSGHRIAAVAFDMVRILDARTGRPWIYFDDIKNSRQVHFGPAEDTVIVATRTTIQRHDIEKMQSVTTAFLAGPLVDRAVRFYVTADGTPAVDAAVLWPLSRIRIETHVLDDGYGPRVTGTPEALIAEWSARLGVRLDGGILRSTIEPAVQ